MAEREATWALLLAAVLALAVATWFAVRYLLLRRSLRQVDRELREIVGHLEDNRIVKLPRPDADLEALLGTVNRALEGIRRQAVAYSRREVELKAQIERISHDLRTPLTSICGYLALVDEGALDAETRESLVVVRRKADSLQRLVTQFYELSRLRGDDERLEPVSGGRGPFRARSGGRTLPPVGGAWPGRARGRARASGVRPCRRGRARARAGEPVAQRRQVRANDAGGDGGRTGRSGSWRTARRPGGRLRNAWLRSGWRKVGRGAGRGSTAGRGRSVGRRGRRSRRLRGRDVFERCSVEAFGLAGGPAVDPFYTVDASRSHESSGLGLAIARSLAERMGGTLEAHAEDRDDACWLTFELVLRSC